MSDRRTLNALTGQLMLDRLHQAREQDRPCLALGARGRASAISSNGIYGISTADRPQSTLMLRARITLPHFSVSSAMSFAKSAGEPGSASPRSARRTFILGSARAALTSVLSCSTISAGVFLTPTPYHDVAS